ncbi:MAG: hypothetical protein JNN15_16480 [Blastocatellia bacterium]|nr:hypothetical protein [Blastocatellia bacterium]
MSFVRIALLFFLIFSINIKVLAADDEKYTIKQIKVYILDKSGYQWSDTGYFLGVRLDATKKESLEEEEITAGTINYSLGEDYKKYSLKLDSTGNCIADVPFVAYTASDKSIYYEIVLLKKDADKYLTVPLSTKSLAISVASNEIIRANASIFRPMMTKDWALYGGIMLVSVIFIYFLIFRWLFSVLLFTHNWPVMRAEYFTTSLSLLLLLAVFALLLVLFLPQTAVMWTVLVVLTVFWVGHAVTWVLS